MMTRWLLVWMIVLPGLLWGGPTVSAHDDASGYYAEPDEMVDDLSPFYDSMSPYGDWYLTPEYGYVWIPTVDHSSWRPYVDDGRWVWSDYGWTWASDYEWGWAAFHYGRWVSLDSYWVWVPDTVWGPAWVAWRYSDDYVGWSALPPGAYWYPDTGLELAVTIPWTSWVFLPGRYIVDANFHQHLVPRHRTNRIYYGSRSATVYRTYGGHPLSVGIDIGRVSFWIGRSVPRYRVSVSSRPGRVVVGGGVVSVYRAPTRSVSIRHMSAPPAPRRAAPAALIRTSAPPPPTRAGAASSQYYHRRAEAQSRAVRSQRGGQQRYQGTPPAPRMERRTPTKDYRRSPRPQQRKQYRLNKANEVQKRSGQSATAVRMAPSGRTVSVAGRVQAHRIQPAGAPRGGLSRADVTHRQALLTAKQAAHQTKISGQRRASAHRSATRQAVSGQRRASAHRSASRQAVSGQRRASAHRSASRQAVSGQRRASAHRSASRQAVSGQRRASAHRSASKQAHR